MGFKIRKMEAVRGGMTLASRALNMVVKATLSLRSDVTGITCPVCMHTTTKALRYGRFAHVTGESRCLPEVSSHRKYICVNCGHCFANWLDGDLANTADKYAGIYDGAQLLQEGPRARYEEGLFRYVLRRLGNPKKATLLDFGCGPNRSPVEKLRNEGFDARGCDILPIYSYDGDVFFQHTANASPWLGRFDGIVSIDVVEHLADTIGSWSYFNRILKPGGIMAHCFPSQIHYSFLHSYFRTPFHVCLFSRRSISLLLERTGFVLDDVEPFDADVPYVFCFRKTREIK